MGKIYKLLTGPDNGADFCHKVSKNLAEGWELHGSASIAFDSSHGVMMCAQAVTKEVTEPYNPEKPLSDHA